jgi:hypothetical protein
MFQPYSRWQEKVKNKRVKPVIRGHLWDKEKVALSNR